MGKIIQAGDFNPYKIVFMKKILLISLILPLLICGCSKVGIEHLHDNCEISSIDITNFGFPISHTVPGKINQETGEILFPIPKELKKQFDLTKLKVRANVAYDAIISPSLTGLKNLYEANNITVTARMTGKSKNYTIRAYYSRD